MGPLPLILGGACPLPRAGARHQCLLRSTVLIGWAHHPNWTQTEEGGWKRRILVYHMAGAFLDCYRVVVISKKSEKKKRKKKNMKGGKGNEEEGKKSPSYGISAAAGMMIRSVHIGSQCG